MALILIIDVCLPVGHIVLANETIVLDHSINTDQQQHAKWLHVTIDELMRKNNVKPTELTHIAVTNGPGSYTGIRVGLSAAKGLAFGLNIPVIVVSNLALIAFANTTTEFNCYIPMVDARRNEVFTAIYDDNTHLIGQAFAHVIEAQSFANEFAKSKTLVCGKASQKFKNLVANDSYSTADKDYNITDLYTYTLNQLNAKNLKTHQEVVANYIKQFFNTQSAI